MANYVLLVGEAMSNYANENDSTVEGVTFTRVDHMKPYTSLEMAEEVGEAMLEAGRDTYVVIGAYQGYIHIAASAFARAEKVAA